MEGCVVVIQVVFSGSKQEEETKADHVRDSLGRFIRWCSYVRGDDTQLDQGERNRLHAMRWRIFLYVRAELAIEAEVDFSSGVESDVTGPHACVRLTDVTNGVHN